MFKNINLLGKNQTKTDSVEERCAQKLFEQLKDISPGVFSWDTDKLTTLAKLFKDIKKVKSSGKTDPKTCVNNTDVIDKESGTWNVFHFKNAFYPVYVPDFEWYVVSVLQMLHDKFKMKNIYKIFNEYQQEMNESYQTYRVSQLQKYTECIENNKNRYNDTKQLKTFCSEFEPYSSKDAAYLYKVQFFALLADTITITLARMSGDVSSQFGTTTLNKVNSSRWRFTTECTSSIKWPTVEEDTVGYTKKQPSQTEDILALNTMYDDDVLSPTITLSSASGNSPTALLSPTSTDNSTLVASPQSINSGLIHLSPFARSLTQESELKAFAEQKGGCGCMTQYGGTPRRKVSVRHRKSSVRRRKSSVRRRKSSVRRRKSSVRRRKSSVRRRKSSVRRRR